ncbi:MAG: DUF551 domain-containing protein [Chlorobiales bacterium]|nr:DUF551 domain-containing protein [Chlorobiales bacterium]
MSEELKLEWRKGEPPKYLRDDWFIAKTKERDRFVLRSLPDEYSYDYTTADGTYIKAENIEAWMQFPDSPFVEPEYESRALKERIAAYEKVKANNFNEWQPIETAPHNEIVVLYCPDRDGISNRERIEIDFASRGTRNAFSSDISCHSWATHWMPLPEPPKGKVDE